MRFIKSSALALTVCAAAAVPAFAAEQATQASCVTAGGQVSAAVKGAQNADAAREKRLGMEFCNAGYFRQGMAHYARAMELAGGKLARN
jgi:hypothetical protein